jgi:aspartate/glutamate racemase
MKKLGMIGGIAPGSTVDYYHQLIALYREKTKDDSYPPILINSLDLTRMLGLVSSTRLVELAAYLREEIECLAHARRRLWPFGLKYAAHRL